MKEVLLEQIDLSASKLKPYMGFIFLCGGETDITSHRPVSVRDAIHRGLARYDDALDRIRVAEDYKDWSSDGVYRDLVSFERHLAELSSVIVLVLESPGSLAELGLFSVIEEYQRKLLVFVDTQHYQSDSFIKLGPIDYLEKTCENTAECHKWLSGQGRAAIYDVDAAEDIQPDLVSAVMARAKVLTPERNFDGEKWLDCALLICDFLGLLSALTIREIRQLLEGFGCGRTEGELKQVVFLLQKVGLIEMEPRGDQRFYIAVGDCEYIAFHVRDRAFDFMRFRADVLTHYEKNDKKRYRAIQEVRRRRA